MKTAAIVVFCALLPAATATAGVTVTASVSGSRITLGEQIVLSVAITGSGSASPKLPAIADVEIYESGRSQSMTINNGSVTSSVTYAFMLAPRKAGKFRVPAIEVSGAAPTEPIDIEVLAAGAPASPNMTADRRPDGPASGSGAQTPDAFVTATLQKNRAFVNEQVTLVVRFFTAVPLLGRPQYDAPKFSGLLFEDLGAGGQGTTSIGGRIYSYSEIKAALFAVSGGRASVGPAVVTVALQRHGLSMGDDFFDRFFGLSAPETRRLMTDPLTLQVDPLPPGKPEDFSGVVGRLTIDVAVDRSTVKAGEAVTLTVNVRGTGNIKSLPEPKRPDLPAARFFDSESSVTLERSGDKIGGTKTFRVVLVPRVSGPLDIPSLSVSYFDPEKRTYVRAFSAPIRLSVLPGDPNAALPVVGPGSMSAPGVTVVASDIGYLKAPDDRGFAAKTLSDALADFGAPGSRHALPFAFFLAAVLFDWRRRLLEADPTRVRARAARAAAERRLRAAAAASDAERIRAVNLLAEALSGYCADKLGLPVAGLTLKSVVERLQAGPRPTPSGNLARLKAVWEELDCNRFAPGGVPGTGVADQDEVIRLANEIRELTRVLDKDFSP